MADAQRIPTFVQMAKLPDDQIDLGIGAALISRDVYDALEVKDVLRELDEMAAPLASRSLAELPPQAQAEAVSEHFRDLGFRGNLDEYYDPRNSLVCDVIERRLGIPITLSVIWCEIARRAGVNARGVGFPGHFLARVDDRRALGTAFPAPPAIVDPFGGGRLIGDDDARQLLKRALGDGAELHPSLFAAATSRAVLVRMLTNLKAIWASRGDHARAFVAIDRIVTLVPDSARNLRERAAVALRLGAADLARVDLSRVLELEPQAPDVPQIKDRLAKLTPTGPKRTLN